GRNRGSVRRRDQRARVGEPVVPAHGAPAPRRRRRRGARARRAVGRVVPGRGDGRARRARSPRPLRADPPGRHGAQGRGRGDPVHAAARRRHGVRQRGRAARDRRRQRAADARGLARRRRPARVRPEWLSPADPTPRRVVCGGGRRGRGRGARLVHLETIVVALAAGLYLATFAPVEGERVRHELKRGWQPVYILFFVLAGAGLRLGALAELWPWVLLLVGLRATSMRYGLLWAGRHPSVTSALAREGWLGLVPQAGSALGLVQVARRAFPEWGVSLETLAVAIIGVHE